MNLEDFKITSDKTTQLPKISVSCRINFLGRFNIVPCSKTMHGYMAVKQAISSGYHGKTE